MPRVLLTGAAGFVGPYLAAALGQVCGDELELIATAKCASCHERLGNVHALDVTDAAVVARAVAQLQPTHVVHLAGIAATAAANADPQAAWRVHLDGTLNLARAVLHAAPGCWLISVGSGLVYGSSAKHGRPLDEDCRLEPVDEYAATKAAADLALGALSRSGLNSIRLRPFNHTGPGQSEDFVVPALAMQIARIEAGLAPPVLRVGNLDTQRDFLDVRDVAQAYALVVKKARQLAPGTVLNIASGTPRRIGDILAALMARSRVQITVAHDPARRRSADLPVMVGDPGRAQRLLGWKPVHAFDDTLDAVLEDCRRRARATRSGCPRR